jgi:hypothetical protein
MKTLRGILMNFIVLGLASGAYAAPVPFAVPLDGFQEVPGPADPDGTGTAFLAIDPVTLTINWDIVVNNIDSPLTGAHIHRAPVGVAGPIVVDFSSQLSGTGLTDRDLADVLANPTGFYVNVHTLPFPAGAIRGQLDLPIPAPSALGLVALGLLALRLSRRTLA